jgi:2-(1,2-epoxy-1,2-dihydrophenyl)acetyl-CoA isomerase
VISKERIGDITLVRIERPERRNAMVPELLAELVDHLRGLGEVRRPIVLTGTERAFCPGADLKWLGGCPDPAVGVAELVALLHNVITTLLQMPAPVIAAINGITAGGGLGLALAADYRLASDRATFTAAYFRVGLTPDGGSSAFLQRMIGSARTMELLLTNRTLDAHEAQVWGIVNAVVPHADLMDRAVALANDLTPVPPATLLETRRLLDMTGIHNQLQLEAVAVRAAAKRPEFRAAIQAFLEAHPSVAKLEPQ